MGKCSIEFAYSIGETVEFMMLSPRDIGSRGFGVVDELKQSGNDRMYRVGHWVNGIRFHTMFMECELHPVQVVAVPPEPVAPRPVCTCNTCTGGSTSAGCPVHRGK